MALTATERWTGERANERPAGRSAPDLHASLVARPRLTERLLGSPRIRLVLLTAPAGYSKTTCLAEWTEADQRPFAWITVNDRHDDPALLVATIVDALGEIEPVDAGVLAALSSPKPSISEVVLPRLAGALRDREPFVLIVDDVHALSSADAFEVLEAVIGAMPDRAQLALAARHELPLPLGRLRAKRQLLELQQPELAMTPAEGGELLGKLGLNLGSAQLDAIMERTEAWPAALYLAGLSLLDQPDTDEAVAGFAGDDRIVVDYLRDEFLATTSPEILSFLTRTSLLDELSGPLCDAVLERSGSARLLRDLARSNALIVSLDRKDSHYRYHQLFAGELRSELRLREPELEAELHARASGWYAENGDSDRAIEHAIAAGDVERAGELIWLAYPEASGRGRIASIERWLDELGEGRVGADGPLSLTAAHTSMVLGEGGRAAHWVRVAEASVEGSPKERDAIRPDLLLLKATLAADGVVQMGKDAARASELHPPETPWQGPCYLYRGVSSHLSGQPERARPLLQEAARRGAVGSPIIQVLALSQLSLIAIEDRDLETGSRLVAQARGQVARCALIDYPSMLMVAATSATVRAREGQVTGAQEDLAEAMRLLPLVTELPPWYEAQARLLLATVLVRLDEPGRARPLLKEASRFLELTPDAAILRAWLHEAVSALESASTEGRAREWSLTKAELRTLQYLPSHLSFRAIGERIHVSPNTVKTQAQAVYRKLGASSRAEAVEKARSVGLLGEDPLRED